MGRTRETQPPVDAAFIRESFAVGDDGAIIRRSTGEIATFKGPGAQLLVRVYHQGRIRRFVAGRVAWALSTGKWPRGVVRLRRGDSNFSAGNLIVVKAGARPFDQGKGGRASSLERRQERNAALLKALAEHPGQTVPMLSRLVGSSESCCCTRLGGLADAGLCVGPKCDARARWDLTPQGRELAIAGRPMIDDLDKRMLVQLARAPSRLMQLVSEIGSCRLTARRRVNGLIERGLAQKADDRYMVTEQGRTALGDQCPKPWIDLERIRASTARDVAERHGENVMTRSERGRLGGLAAARSRAFSPLALTG